MGKGSNKKNTKLVFIDDFYKRRSVADYYINYHGFLYGKKINKIKTTM